MRMIMISILRATAFTALAGLAIVQPASAQWTAVAEVPATNTIFSVWANGDTIVAGADESVFLSTDSGATWRHSATVASGTIQINAARMRNGRLYAGGLRRGVFVSDDLGQTWLDFNQGLVGGFGDSQLDIADLLIDGNSLYVATIGDGPWKRNLNGGTWTRFGNAFGPAQSTNMQAIAVGGTRLLASAGFNGQVFFRDAGQPDWTESLLFNDRFAAGLAPLTAIWTGTRWVVGTNTGGVFLSDLGQSPWTFTDFGIGLTLAVSFALRGSEVFASFSGGGTGIMHSPDAGATWQVFDILPGVATSSIAISRNTIYAGRLNGLWRRPLTTASVPPRPSTSLRFAISGAQPVRDVARFSFALPEAGRASIEIFDMAGRRSSTALDASMPAGPHEIAWSAGDVSPGVYHARLRFGQRTEAVRLIRVR